MATIITLTPAVHEHNGRAYYRVTYNGGQFAGNLYEVKKGGWYPLASWPHTGFPTLEKAAENIVKRKITPRSNW